MRTKVYLLLLLILAATPVFSQRTGVDVSASTKVVPQELQQLELANKLIQYGRQAKSALPLIQAVQIYRDMKVVDEVISAGQENPYSEATLLEDATRFADGNKPVLNLIAEMRKSTRAGVNEDPTRYYRVLEPGEAIQQQLYVPGSQYVQIVVDGQGEGISSLDNNGNSLASDLRLMVLDKEGRVIASDQSRGENCAVAFISRTSNMTIVVRNVGQITDSCIIYIYKTGMNY